MSVSVALGSPCTLFHVASVTGVVNSDGSITIRTEKKNGHHHHLRTQMVGATCQPQFTKQFGLFFVGVCRKPSIQTLFEGEAGKDRWLAVTVNDRQEILDVRPYDPPFELPRLEPPPRIVWWVWCWWPWNWFRRYCCVSRRRAQELFDLCAATTCDPLTVPPPCIPFLYPDDGCWGGAHRRFRRAYPDRP